MSSSSSRSPAGGGGLTVRDVRLDDVTLRCFDCSGDVDVTETTLPHVLIGRRSATLFIACFDLSQHCRFTVEPRSFLLGRLQLWLQYIFCKVERTILSAVLVLAYTLSC